jgi:Uma2 family endonuclease
MKDHPQRHYTVGEYFAIEQSSEVKHEYYEGEIFAMAGASVSHNRIVGNLLAALNGQLRGSDCEALGSDLRVQTPSGLYTYPDVMVVCGKPLLVDAPLDTVANPVLIAEVLSDSTAEYDRGEKFDLYRTIPTLREYVLIEQKKVSLELFSIGKKGWASKSCSNLDDRVQLGVSDAALSLLEVYERVFPDRRS